MKSLDFHLVLLLFKKSLGVGDSLKSRDRDILKIVKKLKKKTVVVSLDFNGEKILKR